MLPTHPPTVSQKKKKKKTHPPTITLGKGPLNALTPTPDMDRTVSRRSLKKKSLIINL